MKITNAIVALSFVSLLMTSCKKEAATTETTAEKTAETDRKSVV